MNKRLFLLIVPLLLLASCQREMDWSGSPEIKAMVEAEQKTRTSLSVDETGAGTIVWNPADKIDVFYGTTKADYTSQNTSDAAWAIFKTTATLSDDDVSSTNIWGLYPSNSSSSCNGSSITTVLPSTQYGVPNTFDRDLFMGVAHSTSRSLQFYNVCGGIKFNLAYDDIKKVTFRGNNNENLAGTVSITFVDGLPKATIVNGIKEITLTPKTGATFTKGANYYFILLPGTLSAGFTMTFTATDGTTGTLNYTDKSVTIKRSVFSRKGNMDVYASFADERQANNVIYYTSSDGKIITPNHYSFPDTDFGANIISNDYVNGKGVLVFDGDVTRIGYGVFAQRLTLTSIEIPNSVTVIDDFAFSVCTGLTSIEIPNSVTTLSNSAFYSCSGLTSIVIPASVTEIRRVSAGDNDSNPFYACTGLTSIVVDPNNPSYDSRNNCNAIIDSDTNALISGCQNTIIPNSVSSIKREAFAYCTGLTSIIIPNSVTFIDRYAFYSCTGLSFLEISDSVTSISYGAFADCSGLTSIEIPSSVTFLGGGAFYRCTGLKSITVSASQVPEYYKDEVGPFDNTNNCVIYVPRDMAKFNKSSWGEYASRIQPICPKNVIYYITADDSPITLSNPYGFGANIVSNTPYSRGDTKKKMGTDSPFVEEPIDGYYYDPNNYYPWMLVFDGDVTSIGDYAFFDCQNLVSITIPNSVTSIGNGAFMNCSSLHSITIPESVSTIGGAVFSGCYWLKSILSLNPVPPAISSGTFSFRVEEYPPSMFGYHIFVPEESVAAYQNAGYCNNDVFYNYDCVYPFPTEIATGFYIPTYYQTCVLDLSEHKKYTVNLLDYISIFDNVLKYKNYALQYENGDLVRNKIIDNGVWVTGDGANGIPNGISAWDFYGFRLRNMSYDTSSVPSALLDMISIDENYQLCFDYLDSSTMMGTIQVRCSFDFCSIFPFEKPFTVNVIIRGEDSQ